MGKELRRVPLDFDWPLNKIWGGYVNPHYKFCPGCHETDHLGKPRGGTGTTPARAYLSEMVRLLMLAGNDGQGKRGNGLWPHPWVKENPMWHGLPAPDKELMELTDALAGRPCDRGPFGYDSSDNWTALGKILKAAKVPKDWGICKVCKGSGIDPAAKAAYRKWRPKEPPKGDGYQLWETTTEGSPVSPVFKTLQELCDYAALNCSTFGYNKATVEQWHKMLDANFVHHTEGGMTFL